MYPPGNLSRHSSHGVPHSIQTLTGGPWRGPSVKVPRCLKWSCGAGGQPTGALSQQGCGGWMSRRDREELYRAA